MIVNCNQIFPIVLLFLVSLTFSSYHTQAAKFIRNVQSNTCLQHLSNNNTSSCFPLSSISCPTDRFGSISTTVTWNLIPVDPSLTSNSTNATKFFIESSDNQFCLSSGNSSTHEGIQVCPCDNSVSQRWNFNGASLISSESNGECLSMTGSEFVLENCNLNTSSMSWKSYHVAPNAVNVYTNTLFSGKFNQLHVGTYTSKELSTLFSSPFSLEVPPGFQFTVNHANGNTDIYNFDTAQVNAIVDLTSVTVKLKSGMLIYEQPAYFGASDFFETGASVSSTETIGSVMVPAGFRGIIWKTSNFTGENLGLFEPIPNFSGVTVTTRQETVGSLDVSAATCQNECSSGGFCSVNNTCTCKPGFTGSRCDQCLPGFWGPTCQACSLTCGNSIQNTCDDGLFGTGKCKCATGFTGVACNTCSPGFFGDNCTACDCGIGGICNNLGNCSCIAGWGIDPKNRCNTCKEGYYFSVGNCKACPPGCSTCSDNGSCTACLPGLQLSTNNTNKCVIPPSNVSCPDGQYLDGNSNSCSICDPSCGSCFDSGPSKCLTCKATFYYLEGSCVPANLGTCIGPNTTQSFFVDTAQGICDACPSTCTSCSIPNFGPNSTREDVRCSLCMAGNVLDNGQCVKTCSDGKFVSPIDQLTCTACDVTCATCNGPSASQCLSCSNPKQFSLNGVCSENPCPSSYVAINTTCTKCHPDCLECSGPALNQCTKCPPNRPILTKEGQCDETCPMGTFEDSTGKCQVCDPSCSSCTGPQADQCLGCTDELQILTNGTCGGGCPGGTVMLISERMCYNLNDSIIPSDNFADGANDDNSGRRLTWWEILLIVISALILLILLILAIRFCAVRRRRVKTNSFKEQIDEVTVAKKMSNLMNSSLSSQSSNSFDYQRQLPRPEISHESSGAVLKHEIDPESLVAFSTAVGDTPLFANDLMLISSSPTTLSSPLSQVTTAEELSRVDLKAPFPPPVHKNSKRNSYRNSHQKRRTSYTGKDYLRWKVGKKFGDSLMEEASYNNDGEWDGFDAVIASGKQSSSRRSSSSVRRSGTVTMGRFGYVNHGSIDSEGGGSKNPFRDNSSSIYSTNSIGNNSWRDSIGGKSGSSGFNTIIGAYVGSDRASSTSQVVYGRNSGSSGLQQYNALPMKKDENWGSNWI